MRGSPTAYDPIANTATCSRSGTISSSAAIRWSRAAAARASSPVAPCGPGSNSRRTHSAKTRRRSRSNHSRSRMRRSSAATPRLAASCAEKRSHSAIVVSVSSTRSPCSRSASRVAICAHNSRVKSDDIPPTADDQLPRQRRIDQHLVERGLAAFGRGDLRYVHQRLVGVAGGGDIFQQYGQQGFERGARAPVEKARKRPVRHRVQCAHRAWHVAHAVRDAIRSPRARGPRGA